MKSHYWIKLYHEILDDAKMGRLPDRLWRRAIELFLLAGEEHNGGHLPALTDIAWRLRMSDEDVLNDLKELEQLNIVKQLDDETWFVTKFAERQSAMSNAERQQRYRNKQRKEQYYGDDTDNDAVTICNADTDIDIDTDVDTTMGANAPSKSTSNELPHNLDGWLGFIRDGKGQSGGMTARLGRMLVTLWPDLYDGLDPPYGKIGGVARNVNGAARLAQLLWQANAAKVTGDPLEYATAMHRRSDSGNGKGKGTQERSLEAIEEWG